MHMLKPHRRNVLMGWLIFLVSCPLIWLGVGWYTDWYEQALPVVPLPAGARLLARNPDDAPYYWSSTTRYWYSAKYSTPLSANVVQAFYHSDGGAARPVGIFSVTVLPPLPDPKHTNYDERLVAAQRRDSSDPPGETLILVAVNWTPLDQTGFIPFAVCGIPLLWLSIGGVLIIWSKRTLHRSQTQIAA